LFSEDSVPAGLKTKSLSKSFPWPALWLIVIAQAAVHLALLSTGGWIGDTRTLQTWAGRLLGHPISSFYASESRADHLPGDLWILRVEAWVYHLYSGHSPSNDGFLNALKLGPGLADVGIAVVLYLIAREMEGGRAGRRAAFFFALNPAPFFISMVWGVADSVSMFFAALALLLAVRRWFWAAIPVLAYACLIKPQFGILAPLLLIFFLHEAFHRTDRRRWLRPVLEMAAAGAVSVGVLRATLLPFQVGLPGMNERWSLVERITFSASLYTNTTMNALNLWALVSAAKLEFPADNAPLDHVAGLFGLSYQHWAILLTSVAIAILVLPLIRKGGAARLVWTCTAVTFAFFMLQTRMHERYFFPAIALMAVAVALRPRWFPIYVVMSGVYFANIWWVYRWLGHPQGSGSGLGAIGGRIASHVGFTRPGGGSGSSAISANEVRALVAVNLAVLGLFVAHAIRDFRKPSVIGIVPAVPIPEESQGAYVDTDWPPLRETPNQSSI